MRRSKNFISILFSIMLMVYLPFPSTYIQAQEKVETQFHQRVSGVQHNALYVPSVVLVGLKSQVDVGVLVRGAEGGEFSIMKAFRGLDVQDVVPAFPEFRQASLIASPTSTKVNLDRIYRLHLKPDSDVERTIEILNSNPAVEFAELDYLAHITTTPNDPEYTSQWSLEKINAPASWDVITGTTDVTIAIVDAGIDLTHPDLSGQLWQNPGEIAGNGIDDDNNGYVDDIHGWNLVDNNADLSDNTGHGTEIAGIAAAATDNYTGISGMCWNCRLMVVKVVQPGGVANYSDIAAGLIYAAQKGAKVINISLGGNSDSITLRTAIAYAAQTAVIVSGAGNNNSSAPFYPAAYDDYVLAVASTSQTDTKADTSNYGIWVDVSAPGENIRTTFTGNGYGDVSGTSVATSIVSGLAGLVRSLHPDWSVNLVRAQIVHTTDHIDGLNPGYEGKLGSGRINAFKAVSVTTEPRLDIVNYTVNGIASGAPSPGSTVSLNVMVHNSWGKVMNATGHLSASNPYVTLASTSAQYGDIDAYATAMNSTPFSFSISSSAPYAHAMSFSLTISGAGGVDVVLPLTITTQSSVQDVFGLINNDTTWTSDKIYHVINNVAVLENVTLTIQPGTVVKFAPGKSLLIDGRLIADGREGQPIIFTSDKSTPAPGDWNMIKFGAAAVDAVIDSQNEYLSGSILRHARVEYANGLVLMEAMPYISHVTFYRNAGTHEGEIYWFLPNGALWRKAASGRPGNFVVRDSVFLENQSGGLVTYVPYGGASYTVSRNRFLNNNDTAIAFAMGGLGVPVEITANYISNNGGGIYLSTDSPSESVLIKDNTFLGSTNGAYLPGYAISLDTTSPIIHHNIFADQTSPGCTSNCSLIFAHDQSVPTVTNNTFVNNTLGRIICFNCTYGFYSLNEPGVFQNNNWEANQVEYVFQRGLSSTRDIIATNNYWGTTNPASISQLIFDYFDDLNPGKVLFQPFLTEPDPNAPAYVRDVEISPNPAGIEKMTLRITFSAPMDHSTNPMVTFGNTAPYTQFEVLDEAQWLNEKQWRASFYITSLVPRGSYTIRVAGAKGADGMEIPTDTRFNFVIDYAGQITDQTPPSVPVVIAGGKVNDPSTVEATWWSIDPDSSITAYRYAIGSAPGATDIVNWTMTSSNSFSKTGLGLIEGRKYWVIVQARNIGGLWSASGYGAVVAGRPVIRTFLPVLRK